MSSTQPEKNAIYYFVKDIITEKESSERPLREIANDRWTALSEPQMCLLKDLLNADKEPVSGEESILCTTLTESDTSLQKEVDLLNTFFGNNPTEHRFNIFSSQVFVHTPDLVIPAEIGVTRCSFKEGIIDSIHSLVNPGQIPVGYIKQAVDWSEDVHKIPIGNQAYPNLAILLRALHGMMHTISGNNEATDLVFIEDDQFEMDSAVLLWLERQSVQLGLDLEWKLIPLRLSALWIYLKEYHGELHYDDRDRFAFKTSLFDYLDLCRLHSTLDCANCALSKAHIYSYILSRKFAPKFGVDLVAGRHLPYRGSHWYF